MVRAGSEGVLDGRGVELLLLLVAVRVPGLAGPATALPTRPVMVQGNMVEQGRGKVRCGEWDSYHSDLVHSSAWQVAMKLMFAACTACHFRICCWL